MIKSNKIPQKNTQTLNHYTAVKEKSKMHETDTSTVTTSSISTTHIFNK